ncbi:hypothetical protein QR680_001818 [Steinernema hermaphroditum]|uniref:Myosin motor domain-containing protein n=1 Tax=Steinernema hermaphroditum TaxID=289476 RepID=A0AA39LGV9_9BILA|nr:hypothetical protein QR680_001818 [Steinernema hermaphroditum]
MSTLDRRHQFRRVRVLSNLAVDPLLSDRTDRIMPSCSTTADKKQRQIHHSTEDLSQLRCDVDELIKKLDSIRCQLDSNGSLQERQKRLLPSRYIGSQTDCRTPPPLPPRTYRITNLVPHAPPKPQRTYTQCLQNLSNRFDNASTAHAKLCSTVSDKWIKCSKITAVDDHLDEMCSKFRENICWFELEGKRDYLFVNPYNDLNDTKCRSYNAMERLIKDIFDNHCCTVLFCGDANSGKSYLAEMLVTELSMKLSGISTMLSSAMLIINALTNVRTETGQYSSISTNEYKLIMKDGCLSHVSIDICMTELSPIAQGDLKLCDILMKGLTAPQDREKYYLDPIDTDNSSVDMPRHMRDLQLAFSVLSVSSTDVFRVISACLHLRKIVLTETAAGVETLNIKEVEHAAHLLGISPIKLYLCIVQPSDKHRSIEQAKVGLENLIKSLYQRCSWSVFRRINIVLQHYCSAQSNSSLISDGESSANDSGIELHSKDLTLTVIDCFGISKRRPQFSTFLRNMAAERMSCLKEGEKHPQLQFSELNLVCQIMRQAIGLHQSAVRKTETPSFASLAKNIEKKSRLLSLYKSNLMVNHFDGRLPVTYDTNDFISSNSSAIPASAVDLFNCSDCTFAFVRHLYTNDTHNVSATCQSSVPVHTPFSHCGSETTRETSPNSVIHDYHESISTLLGRACGGNLYKVHCFSSNDQQEYSFLNYRHLQSQFEVYFEKGQHTATETHEQKPSGTKTRFAHEKSPPLPYDRNYSIREGRKHAFPQRRVVRAEYYDPVEDYTFTRNQVIRVSGFSNNTKGYVVDVGQHRRPTIPTHFTDVSHSYDECTINKQN